MAPSDANPSRLLTPVEHEVPASSVASSQGPRSGVSPSSFDHTDNIALASKTPTVDDVLAQIGRKDYYTEGLVGNRILRFTLPKP